MDLPPDPILHRPLARYVLALVSAWAALLLHGLIAPLVGHRAADDTIWVAVTFAAWFCGTGPAILATVVYALTVWIFAVFPKPHEQGDGILALISFLLFSGLIIALSDLGRRLKAKRQTAERQAQSARAPFETFMDNSPDLAFMKDRDGRYIYVNRTFRERFGNPHPEGKTDFDLFPEVMASNYRANDLEVLRERRPKEFIEQTEDDRGKRLWLSVKFVVDDADGKSVLCGKSFDVTDRIHAEETLREAHHELERRVEIRTGQLIAANASLRELSARLLQVRDQEHRKIARELHDSVGQLLAAISMNITAVQQKETMSPETAKALTESMELLDQVVREIRTISHLLHPPLLDEVGLSSALRWYVDGFAERSGVKVDLSITPGLARFPEDIEVALFRLVQECLTNIHRHSESPTARISLHPKEGWVCLEISDAGKGIPEEKRAALESDGQVGVGIRGMRERLRQIGGLLEVESGPGGTLVRASIPASDQAGIASAVGRDNQKPCAAA